MKLIRVIHFLNLATVLALLILLFNFVSEIYPGPPVYPEYAHITLYLDRNFDEDEVDVIMSAAWEWSEATNHRIEYDVVQMPVKNPNLKDSVFIVKKTPDDPSIFLKDLFGGNQTLGLFEPGYVNSISLVTDRLNDDNYRRVVLHELGHSLGIGHLKELEDMDALMFPYTSMKLDDGSIINTGSDHVTNKDLVQFCKLYHCNADKL